MRVFEEISSAIQEGYILDDFGGLDWSSEAQARRREIEGGVEPERFVEVVRELVSLLPEDTASYLTRQERIEAELAETAVYTGIGAFVALRAEPEPRIILLSVIEGSPAEQAGLQSHDAIYAIDGAPVRVDEGDGAIQRVRGSEGTQVRLLVGSPQGVRRTYTLTRRQVTATDPVRAGVYAGRLAYVLAPVSADSSLLQAVGAALSQSAVQFDGLILDLRVAHSSPDWPILELFSMLADGEMGTFTNRQERSPVEIQGVDSNGSQSIPLVLLVGPDTSGTPEIFASSLQATGRVSVVGLPTAGLVLGFTRRVLNDGSLLVFASSSFETSDGSDIGFTGVPIDVLVEADWDQVSAALDPVLQAAGEILLSTNPP
jgi:carboxyl-terminal processing protease